MKILKDILVEVNKIKTDVRTLMFTCDSRNERYIGTMEEYKDIISQQDKIIQTLMGNWKDNKEFECIAFVPYRGKPVVIKDGKILSNENMTSFDVSWAYDSRVEVTVNNE